MSNLYNKLALGTAQFGMPYGIANKNGQVGKSEVNNILDYAFKTGIDTIDTAADYGNSEQIIGQYLNEHADEPWFIITKVSGPVDNLNDHLKRSIDKLNKTPHAVLAHSAEIYLENSFCAELHRIKESMGIKQAGVSVYTIEEIENVLKYRHPDVIQFPMNILDTRLYRKGILSKIKSKAIEVHVRSAFLQGLFYLPDEKLNTQFSDAYPAISQLKSLAQKQGLTLAELSLLWLCSLDQVDKVIIGVDNVEQVRGHTKTLEKNVDAAIFEEALSIKYENENILNPSLWSA